MNWQVPAILGGLALVLFLMLWALWEFVASAEQRRLIAARSALDQAEYEASTPLARLDARLRRTQWGARLARRMARSGTDIRPATFVVALVSGTLLTVLVVWHVLAPFFGLLAAAGVAFLFFSYLRRAEVKRREEFTNQLPDLARVLGNATSAGLALPTAVAIAADELDGPAGEELGRMAESMKLGASFEEAIADLRQRMPSRELGVLLSTLVVASRSGGSLVTALRNISGTLESRKETRREVSTILSETTSTVWALAFMSVGALFMVNGIEPGIMRTMTSSGAGIAVLLVVAALYATGFALVARITRFKM
ncbi:MULTISPECIES: type II secretion system F family protein [unclassified Nocardiopsis]|uniref:type II secretion system F family protein n=1 Tax=unclassified Nocardiopsis TaxID=2649073 RepID=UPI00066A342E|nr:MULTISPECIES: type II secretion system F family protein [unclassified Nocardiopsis]MBQ1082623.1 type II secretion system F family protein [Nocardiopsis sp. B62]